MASDPFPTTACASSLSAANSTYNHQPNHAPLPKLWCRPGNWRSKRDFTAKSLRLLSCLAHDYICDAEAVCVGT